MPARDWPLRIQDILDAIMRIEQYVAGYTYETFTADQKTIDAVVRNLEIIGEDDDPRTVGPGIVVSSALMEHVEQDGALQAAVPASA